MSIQISPEQKTVYQGYRDEAIERLTEAASAMEQYKEIVTAAAETTKLSKKEIGKSFKTFFADKVKALSDEASVVEFLND